MEVGVGIDVEVIGEVEVIEENGHCEGYGSRRSGWY